MLKLAFVLMLATTAVKAQTTGWRGTKVSATWPADSSSCKGNAVVIAGADSGNVLEREWRRCVDDRGWIPVKRFDVPVDCHPVAIHWLDPVPRDTARMQRVARDIYSALAEFFIARENQRKDSVRILFRLSQYGGVGDVRRAGGEYGVAEDGSVVADIRWALMRADLSRQRVSQDVQGVLLFRGSCLHEVRADR